MNMNQKPGLKRDLSLGLLTLYGLGTTIGAGIFVLIGKVAGAGGALAPISFLIAAVIAGLSAASFAEMSARFPESGGEAVYVREGLGSASLALMVGLLVITGGVISTSTIVVGFSGYMSELAGFARAPTQVAVVCILVGIAAWGVRFSVTVAAAITVVEIGALVVIIGFGASPEFSTGLKNLGDEISDPSGILWAGVFYGAILAFYAFIGFEDIVNIAEETRDPQRVLPKAIFLTLGVTTVLYALVAILATGAVAPDELTASDAPLSLIFERVSGLPGNVMSVVAIVSILNGALIQIIMGSRMLFGLSRRGWLLGPFASVNPTTRTPVNSILFCGGVILVLTLTLDLEALAVATSYTTLLIFAFVNAALLALKLRGGTTGYSGFRAPVFVPLIGILSIGGLVGVRLFAANS
jgi:APA family basic amino acid/polyamine antiporter